MKEVAGNVEVEAASATARMWESAMVSLRITADEAETEVEVMTEWLHDFEVRLAGTRLRALEARAAWRSSACWGHAEGVGGGEFG